MGDMDTQLALAIGTPAVVVSHSDIEKASLTPTITQVRFDSDLRSMSRFNVFTDNDVPRDETSVFFDENKIGGLKFKCKAWNAVGREGTKISVEQLVPVIAAKFDLKPEDFTLVFSVYAGCSMCPCSPGYVGKLNPNVVKPELAKHNIWVKDVPLSGANRARLNVCMAKQKVKLAKETAEFEAKQAIKAQQPI